MRFTIRYNNVNLGSQNRTHNVSIRPFQALYSSSDVRETADRLGSPFFSADTMRWFSSRLSDYHLPATIGTPSPYGDPEGVQAGYVITSDRTTFGDGAPRGWRARRYEVTRGIRSGVEGEHFTPITEPAPENGWIVDRIDFESIDADDNEGPDAGYNGWHRTKARAIMAAQLDHAARMTAAL